MRAHEAPEQCDRHPDNTGRAVCQVPDQFLFWPGGLVSLKVNLINDPDFTSTIIELIDEYRNKSAHTDIVGMRMYADFKLKLFHDQLLHRFIDALG
jgi:hypothetical protein